jgi:transposase
VWGRVAPRLPAQPASPLGGRPPVPDRLALEAILQHLAGTPWGQIPADVCSGMTALRRLRQWQADGTWGRVLPVLAAALADDGHAELAAVLAPEAEAEAEEHRAA